MSPKPEDYLAYCTKKRDEAEWEDCDMLYLICEVYKRGWEDGYGNGYEDRRIKMETPYV